MNPDRLVSCLCITHRRVPMLRRAVTCFLNQTWPDRELLVVHEDIDADTPAYVVALNHPQVRTLEVPASPHIALGEKRNMAITAARGRFIATWDDDDWSAPARIASQMHVIAQSGVPVCTLAQWVAYDQLLGQAWLTRQRPWEASLVAERAEMLPYPALDRGSDRVVVEALSRAGKLAVADGPHLYVYLYHGANVGSRVHFKRNVFAQAQPMNPAFARRVAELLASPDQAPLRRDEVFAAIVR
ncbi:glycosyltransferase family 2 protein [Variovorax sp. VNK109]|uniref:glycosyltransferase family 2 protein n=1 Tax=Variovorax sp. VNK109 TaxID=3400919 RepID=UPI003C0267AF